MPSTRTVEPRTTTARGARGTWKLRDYPALIWLLLAALLALVHPFVPNSRWLMVHMVLLGAITHAIMVWSTHFTHTLMKAGPGIDDRRAQSLRLWILLAGSVVVMVGIGVAIWPVTGLGAILVATAVVMHAVQLSRVRRASLGGRFGITVRYYLVAAMCLPVGAGLGVLLASAPSGDVHGRALLAHTMVNILGWVGLTVTGTLLTLWPTMLRTRISPKAERRAIHCLPVFTASLGVIIVGALLGEPLVSIVGLGGYVLGIFWWGSAVLSPIRNAWPREFAPASVGLSILWWIAGIVLVAVGLAVTGGWAEFTGAFGTVVTVVVVGFAAQLLTGALSYLVPSVVGGGKAVILAGQRWFDRWGSARLAAINVGLLVCLAPVPSWVRVFVSVVVLVALAMFIPLMLLGIRASVVAKGEVAAARQRGEAPAVTDRSPSIWSGGQLVGAVSAIVLAVSLGVAADPAAAGLTAATSSQQDVAAATGETTTVVVEAHDMYFEPATIAVPAGNRLVIELVNRDDGMVHDLVLLGRASPRLAPGESATLDVGVVAEPAQGWCSIVGHRQQGMVLDIVVDGQAAAEHEGHENADGGTAVGSTTPRIDPGARLTEVLDPVAPALGTQRLHRMTLVAQEVEREVAPGITQVAWTFNGTVPGPTIRGRVGDRFEITLVNDGSLGHSIDFHAGALAPDEPMRTIAPGESLEYHFTAERSGVWMYHCGTAPMTAHVGAGMFGAVIIEPEEGLGEVDREYVVVQSEVFLEPGTGQGDEPPAPVDATAAAADQPSLVVFNGTAYQYTDAGRMFEARVGERVRFWVLAAGPSRATSFHIVGGQFDTMYMEGHYVLGPQSVNAGAQALGLQPAQGGFVELTFPEAGHYPVVTHVFADAERGATGIVHVTD